MKRSHLSCAITSFALSILLACSAINGQSPWPDSWPAGMELRLTYGGGMRYYSSETVIRADGSYTLINEEGRETRTELQFSQSQLDQLLTILKSQRFYNMHSKPRPGIVYDMGTTTMRLTWDNKTWGVSIGASTELPEQYGGAYQAIRDHIGQLLAGKK